MTLPFARAVVTKRKLEDEENPLHLRLLAGPDMTATRFVLQENETGEVIVSAKVVVCLYSGVGGRGVVKTGCIA